MRTKDKLLKLKEQIDKDIQVTNKQGSGRHVYNPVLVEQETRLRCYSKELGYIIRKFDQG